MVRHITYRRTYVNDVVWRRNARDPSQRTHIHTQGLFAPTDLLNTNGDDGGGGGSVSQTTVYRLASPAKVEPTIYTYCT